MPARPRRLFAILLLFVVVGGLLFFVSFESFAVSSSHGDVSRVWEQTTPKTEGPSEGGGSSHSKAQANIDSLAAFKKKMNLLRPPVKQILSNLGPNGAVTVPPMLLSPNHNLIFHEDRPRVRTILVILNSYRASHCEQTIASAFENADTPQHIYVGLVEEHTNDDPSCIAQRYSLCNQSDFCPTDQVRVRRLDPALSLGENFARAIGTGTFRGEKYVLFADSETLFGKNWDSELIKQHEAAKEATLGAGKLPRVVLSAPALPAKADEHIDLEIPTNKACRVCKATIEESQSSANHEIISKSVLRNYEVRFDYLIEDALRNPVPQPFVTMRFLFAESALLAEVPIDPHLAFLPAEDYELLYSIRLWAHEYSIYGMSHAAAYRRDVPSNAPQSDMSVERDSKLRMLLLSRALEPSNVNAEKLTVEEEKYGVSGGKTMKQFFDIIGVDIEARKLTKDWCIHTAGLPW